MHYDAYPQNRDVGSVPEPFFTGAQSSNIPIAFVGVESGFDTIVMVNTSFLQLTGLGHSRLVGQPLATAFADITSLADTEYMAQRLADNQPGTWEIACRRPDGSTFGVSAVMHPLHYKADISRQHILSFYTINDYKEQSSNSAQYKHMLYKHAPGFIATTEGPEHRITFVNDAYKNFVKYKKLEGLTVAEAMPEIVEQGFVTILDGVFQTGVPYRGDSVPFDFPDMESGALVRRYADFVYQPVRDANLKIVGIFVEGYDVTGKKEAQDTLHTIQTQFLHTSRVNAMGTMAATIAHELNQPLSAITNYVGGCLRLVDSGQSHRDEIEQALVLIQKAAGRAGAIIRTLRDLTDRRVRSNVIFELKSVVEESLSLVRSACHLETHFDVIIPADLTLDADRVKIQQVIINLVRNGCEAVTHSATQKITISAHTTCDETVVSVTDTGNGISPEAAQGMFTWSDTAKVDGMGLGLSISRTIVESHGGRIWLEKSSESGSEFRFTIPVKRGESQESQK